MFYPKPRKLLEYSKALDTTTESEKINVMVKKSKDVTMDNQQPSSLKKEKVQRLNTRHPKMDEDIVRTISKDIEISRND